MTGKRIIPSLGLAKKNNDDVYGTAIFVTGKIPDIFTDTTPKVSDVILKAESFKSSVNKAKQGTKADKQQRKTERQELSVMITDLAFDCAMQSAGDAVKFLGCGFLMKQPAVRITSLPVPLIVLVDNSIEKQLTATINKIKGAKMYLFFISSNPDQTDESFELAGTSSNTKFTFSGLESGKRYYIRVQAAGPRKIVSTLSGIVSKICA